MENGIVVIIEHVNREYGVVGDREETDAKIVEESMLRHASRGTSFSLSNGVFKRLLQLVFIEKNSTSCFLLLPLLHLTIDDEPSKHSVTVQSLSCQLLTFTCDVFIPHSFALYIFK